MSFSLGVFTCSLWCLALTFTRSSLAALWQEAAGGCQGHARPWPLSVQSRHGTGERQGQSIMTIKAHQLLSFSCSLLQEWTVRPGNTGLGWTHFNKLMGYCYSTWFCRTTLLNPFVVFLAPAVLRSCWLWLLFAFLMFPFLWHTWEKCYIKFIIIIIIFIIITIIISLGDQKDSRIEK